MQAEKIDVVLYDTKNFHDMSHYEYNKRNTLWKLLCTVFCQEGLKPLVLTQVLQTLLDILYLVFYKINVLIWKSCN